MAVGLFMFIVSVVFCFVGVVLFLSTLGSESASAIHQIFAVNVFMVGAVLFVGGMICFGLGDIHKAIKKMLTPEEAGDKPKA